MARKRSARANAPSKGVHILVVGLVVMLVAGVAWEAHLYLQPLPNTRVAGVSSTASGALVSDDRIIFGGMPRPKNPGTAITILKNDAYIVGYSEARKDPLWSAYRVKKMEHPFVLERPKGEFLTDTRTSAMVKHHDFTGWGYDRGHMTPNAAIARCYGAEAQRQTFLLSNICPQAPDLNRDVWARLEEKEPIYADDAGEVWVVDGPIFADLNGGQTHRLRAGIAVPEAFYKILVEDPGGGQGGNLRAFAVIMPQTVKRTDLPRQFVTTIRQIEDETGLEFLWKLDPSVRQRLESTKSAMWAE